MDRRRFLAASGVTVGGFMLPGFGNAIAAEALLERMDPARKKVMADLALNAATAAGASYCDVRIGRYLQQSIQTRETRVRAVTNSESTGVGIRVIAGGTWGFAATSDLSNAGIVKAAQQAVAIAKANAVAQTEPVRLAPVKSVGEVSWATPIKKNAMLVPVKEKADLLLAANAAAMAAGA
jgi:TldD protein